MAQALANDLLLQGLANQVRAVLGQPLHPGGLFFQRGHAVSGGPLAACRLGHGRGCHQQGLQRVHGQGHHLARPVSSVEQALDQPQPLQLLVRVDPLAQPVTQGNRKAVTALPDPERVLAQAGFALHIGNRPGLAVVDGLKWRRCVHLALFLMQILAWQAISGLWTVGQA